MNERKRVNIKAILADPVLREEIVEGATDFICKVEGIRPHSLSPAAQAVLDAGRKYATQTWSDATHQRFKLGIAAALRAAVDQVVPPALEEEFYDRNQALPLTSMVQIRQKFLVIADELEGVKYGTYRCNLKEK